MVVSRIELRYTDSAGLARAIDLAIPAGEREFSISLDQIAITGHLEHALGGTIVRATIANCGIEPIRLVNVVFDVATGLAHDAPARFFKHGYQSWSGSGAVEVGSSRTHRRDTASHIARLNHQSEAVRAPEFPEAHTSELFSIVESASFANRVMVGFIGAATALTTVTVPAPDRVIARAILDGVALTPRAHREIEPLFVVEASEPAARLASRWADAIGRRMDARVGAGHQRGWCSWYHYFYAITEDALRANIKSLESMRADFPIDIIQ